MGKKKELKVCGSCLSGNIGKKFHESDFDMRFKKGHKLAGIDSCLDCGSDDIYTVKNLLDKAREEGYQNCMDDIWEEARGLRGWTEHDGSISSADIEAGLQEAYLNIENKLKDNK